MTTVSDTWLGELNAGALTGYTGAQPDQGSGGVASSLTSAAVGTRGGPNPPLYSPDNPLFWFGVLLLGVGGFIGVSGWVDFGPVKVKGKA